jgi:FlaA1/EpsC-like NDP-sugar epimerase
MPFLRPFRTSWRAALAFAHDLAAVAAAWCAAYWLRFNLEIPDDFQAAMWARLPWVMALYAAIFALAGLYRGMWRFASVPDLERIVLAVGLGALATPALFTLLGLGAQVPRSVYLISPPLLVLAMGGSRFAYRWVREGGLFALVRHPQASPVLVLGAGHAASLLVRDLAHSGALRVVGLLDDDPAKQGAVLQGVKVLGPIGEVGAIAARTGASEAIVAMPGAAHQARRRAVELATAAGLKVRTVPALADIVSGRVRVSQLREIELDDLLGRDPVVLDLPGLRSFLSAKTVLVSGAGGSIGSELCRQIVRFAPARLVLFELSEYALYAIEQELRDAGVAAELVAVLGDAKDSARVGEVFARWRPEVVFHAAAYKHVPLLEAQNAIAGVRNNVLGTLAIARAAIAAGSAKFVLVSTDKAVNPTSVMGASKRLAELVCQALAREARATEFVIVRFGNVLGSAGSVVPRFRAQIARGGPVTVTHPEMRRYFMSIPEAAQLVLQAGQMGRAGEIYVLDMGEPVKIADLAREMIRLSGLSESDIRIVYTGLRPGEKLYEEPLADTEHSLPTPHPKLRIARARGTPQADAIVAEVEAWLQSPGTDAAEVRARLGRWIPEYAPAESAASPRIEI